MLKEHDKEVIRALIDVGNRKTAHINRGGCPDMVEGHDSRDTECPACLSLIAAQELLGLREKRTMSREEIEALLTRKYEAGEVDAGLYNSGLQFVFLDNVSGKIVFQWFQDVTDIANLL